MNAFKRPESVSLAASLFVAFTFAIIFPLTAEAGCTWKFDWYCSECAKIGGRTTGEKGGYSSEEACEAARSSVRQPVTPSSSCDRVGWCDEAAKPRPAPPLTKRDRGTRSLGGRGYTPPDDGNRQHWEEEIRREEEARAKAEAARKERERQSFEKAKSDLLGSLRGSTLDQGSGLKGVNTGETLKLKSGTPTFGLKGNPGGELRVKDPSAVKLKNPETASVDPTFFTRPTVRLRIRSVPNPMEAPKRSWLRYVRSSRAGLILDALEEGHGDLDLAIDYLDEQIIRYGTHKKAGAAVSYLEGLRTSYAAVGAEYRKQVGLPGEDVNLASQLLLNALLGPSGPRQWPGPKNPKPTVNKNDWRVQRTTMMLQALEESPGDLKKAYRRLRSARDILTAENAEHYLRGVYAYWDYLEIRNRK